MKHIFLSYSSKDLEFRRRVEDDLTHRNLPVWTDDRLKGDKADNWEDYLEDKIKNSSCIVVLLSPAAKDSSYVRAEITCAKANDIQIFPAVVSNDEKDAIPLSLLNYQLYFLNRNYNEGIDRLVSAIQSRNLIEQPSNIDDYLSIPLAGAYSIKEELLALNSTIYLVDGLLWRRIDFGEDIKPTQGNYFIGGVSNKEIAQLLSKQFENFRCFIHRNDGRYETELEGSRLVAFLMPPKGSIPSYLYTWHKNISETTDKYQQKQRLLASREQEEQLLNEAQKNDDFEKFDAIILQVGEWLVTEYGLEHVNHVHRLAQWQFNDSFEVDHIAMSKLIDTEEFLRAYQYAQQIFSYLKRANSKDS